WYVVGLDALLFIGIALSLPQKGVETAAQRIPLRRQLVLFTGLAALAIAIVVLLPIIVAEVVTKPVESTTPLPEPQSQELKEIVIGSIDDNYNKIRSIEFDAELIVENSMIKEERTEVFDAPGGGQVAVRMSPKFALAYHYVLNGNLLARESQSG